MQIKNDPYDVRDAPDRITFNELYETFVKMILHSYLPEKVSSLKDLAKVYHYFTKSKIYFT